MYECVMYQLDKLPAIRDIQNLVDKNILKEDILGAKRRFQRLIQGCLSSLYRLVLADS